MTKGGSGPILLEPGANHYRLIGLEVTRAASPAVVYNLIGPDKGAADHIIFDRMWIHGTAHDETVRGIMLSHLRYVAVVDSYFSDFHCVAKTGACTDSQAIAGGLGDDPMGPFKIVNNFLEAAGECIMMGGGEATVTPADIEIRHNHMFKPLIWMKGQPGFVGGVDGSPFIVKNFFELKNAQRVLFEGNLLENNWGGFSQTGFAILLAPKNQAHGGGEHMPDLPGHRHHHSECEDQPCRQRAADRQRTVSTTEAPQRMAGATAFTTSLSTTSNLSSTLDLAPLPRSPRPPVTFRSPRLHDLTIDHVTAFPPTICSSLEVRSHEPQHVRTLDHKQYFHGWHQALRTTGGGAEKNCAAMPRRQRHGNRIARLFLHL